MSQDRKIFIKEEVCHPPKIIKSIAQNLIEPCTAQQFRAHCQVKALVLVSLNQWEDSLVLLNNLDFKTTNHRFSFLNNLVNIDNSISVKKSKKLLNPSSQTIIKINLTAFLHLIYRTIIQINKLSLRTIININLVSNRKKPKMLLKL